jgi:putative tryptophan/tyrosine transport system substrate-binding protein
MGLQIQVLNASTSLEIDAAFATFVRERPDAVFVGLDPFLISRRVQLAQLATLHRQQAESKNRDHGAEPSICGSPSTGCCRSHSMSST